MSDIRSILTRNDKILIAGLVAAAFLSALPVLNAAAHSGPVGARAVVTVSGHRSAVLSLAANKTLSVRTKAGIQTLRVSEGGIRVTDAPCPRQICRHGGPISRSGQELICVPGEMVVRIEGSGEPGVDAVSR